MSEFPSWRSYWDFCYSILHRSRYFREESAEKFLTVVLETSKRRGRNLPAGSILWRAQLGHDWKPLEENGKHIDNIPCPLSSPIMKPLRDEAFEGRVNPKGIPYLYLATERDTAMAEVRPWVGSFISVSQFKILRDLTLIDCSVHEHVPFYFFEEPDAELREKKVWSDIDQAFSKPVTPNDRKADYVPTQVLAEMFKTNGSDGIIYKSSLGKGANIALFDIQCADLINCFLYEVNEVSFKFSEAGNPYFVKK